MQRVLLVSHDAENHALIHEALRRTFEIHALDALAIDERGVIDATLTHDVDLVIVDIDLQDLCGLAIMDAVHTNPETSDIPVVIITRSHVESQTALSLNRGAADCLNLPCSTLLIQARISAACRRAKRVSSPARDASRLIAFVGAKGGVGTTTVTVNAGVALVDRGFQVTLVDLRGFFGTMASHLGIYPGDHPHNLAELLNEPLENITQDSVEQILMQHTSGMRVLLGAQDGDGYHRVTGQQAEALVKSLRGHATYTLFDLPSWPTEAVEAVLHNCDQVLLVLERDLASLHAAKVLLSTLVMDGMVRGNVAAVIVNRAIVSTPIPLDYLRKNLSCPIAAMIPPAPDACAAAALSHEPLIQFRHDIDCAKALDTLAERLTEDHVPALAF